MNNQNNNVSYASDVKSPVAQDNANSQQLSYQNSNQQYLYNAADPYNSAVYYQADSPDSGNKDVFGILSAVFSSVGLGCCGIQFSIIGIILGIVALVRAKNTMGKSTAGLVGLILGIVSIVMYILFIIAYFSLIVSSISQLDRLLY